MAEYEYSKSDFTLLLESFGHEAAKNGVYISFPGSEPFYNLISTESSRRSPPSISNEDYEAIDKAFSILGAQNRTFQCCAWLYYCVTPNRSFIRRVMKLSKHTVENAVNVGFDCLYENYRKIQGFE